MKIDTNKPFDNYAANKIRCQIESIKNVLNQYEKDGLAFGDSGFMAIVECEIRRKTGQLEAVLGVKFCDGWRVR